MLTMNFSEQDFSSTRSNQTSQQFQKIILAESQPIIFQPLFLQLKKDWRFVQLCSNYKELIENCNKQLPDILVLGTLPEFNCLEIYRKCRNQWHNLPIILLVNQPVVNNYFKIWAIQKGISNVVSSYPQSFSHLLNAIEEVIQEESQDIKQDRKSIPDLEQINTAKTPVRIELPKMALGEALLALNQLTEYSNRYFGPLAIGNYWKKAYASVIDTNPWLQEWSIDYTGKIAYLSNINHEEKLTTEQLQSLQIWVQAFLQECQRVVVDFTKMLRKKHLSPQIDRLISFQ